MIFELEDSKPIFLHDTLAHDVASPYQVWLQKVQQLKRYHPDEQSLEFSSDLDHNRAIQPFHKTIRLTVICYQTKFSCKRISSSADTEQSPYFDYMKLDLEDSKPICSHYTPLHDDASAYQVW